MRRCWLPVGESHGGLQAGEPQAEGTVNAEAQRQEEASKARAGRKTGIRGEDVVQGWGCHVLGGPGGHGKELGCHSKCEEFEHGSIVIDGRF